MEDLINKSTSDLLKELCEIYARKCSELAPSICEDDMKFRLFKRIFDILLFSHPESPFPVDSHELDTYMRWTLYHKRRMLGDTEGGTEIHQNQLSERVHLLKNSNLPEVDAVLKFLIFMSWTTKREDRLDDSSEINAPNLSEGICQVHRQSECTPFTQSMSYRRLQLYFFMTLPAPFTEKDCSPSSFITFCSTCDWRNKVSRTYALKETVETPSSLNNFIPLKKLMECIKILMVGFSSDCFIKVDNTFEVVKGLRYEDLSHSTISRTCKNFFLAAHSYTCLSKLVNDEDVEPLFETSLRMYLARYAVNVTRVPSDLFYPKFFMLMNRLSLQIIEVNKYIQKMENGFEVMMMIFTGLLESSRFSKRVFRKFLLEFCNSYLSLVEVWVFRGICHPDFFVEQTQMDHYILNRESFLKTFVVKEKKLPWFLLPKQIMECGRYTFLLSLIAKNQFSALLDIYKHKPKMEIALNDDELRALSNKWVEFFPLYKGCFMPLFKEKKYEFDHKEIEKIRAEDLTRIRSEKETEAKIEYYSRLRLRQMKYEWMWGPPRQGLAVEEIEDKIIELQAELEEKLKIGKAIQKERLLSKEIVEQYSTEQKATEKQQSRIGWKLERDSHGPVRDEAFKRVFRTPQQAKLSSAASHPLPPTRYKSLFPTSQQVELSSGASHSSTPPSKCLFNSPTIESSNTSPRSVVLNPTESSQDSVPEENEEVRPRTNFFMPLPSPTEDFGFLECPFSDSDSNDTAEVEEMISPAGTINALFSSVTRPLMIQSDCMQWMLLKFYIDDLKIYSHFKIIKNHFFLGIFGDFFTDHVYRLYENKVPPSTFMKSIHNLLEKTLCSRLSFRYEAAENLDTLDMCMVKLTYITDWPLNFILTESCIKKYTSIFDMCWLLNRVTWVLNDCRKSFSIRPCVKGNELLQVNVHLHSMRKFVGALKTYLSVVFENAWTKLTISLKAASSIDRLYQLHVSYIKEITLSALLNRKANKLSTQISNALDIIFWYCQIIRHESEWVRITEGSDEVRNSKFGKLTKLYAVFLKLIEYVHTFVKKATHRPGYEKLNILQQLLE